MAQLPDKADPYGYVDAKGGGLFIYGEHQFQNTKNVELVPVYTTPQLRQGVGLTDDELGECMVLKQFSFDPPYIDKNGKDWTGNLEVCLRGTYENINNKLKEKNT